MAICDWPHGEGPRDKLLQRGAAALSDAELLAVLLRTGRAGCSALDLAMALLHRAGDLATLLAMDANALADEPGVGPGKYAMLQAAMELARRSVEQHLKQADVMSSPARTRQFLQHHLAAREREIFSCLFLDSQHRLLRCEDLFFGTLDGAAVYPREVAVRALQYRAAAVIFAHNHPSGVAEPSAADRRITERLQAGLGLLDIRVLDHIIIGRGHAYSFAESGLL
ncbi:MAG: DNA repair protein RadC [Chromatocurvus sp.]